MHRNVSLRHFISAYLFPSTREPLSVTVEYELQVWWDFIKILPGARSTLFQLRLSSTNVNVFKTFVGERQTPSVCLLAPGQATKRSLGGRALVGVGGLWGLLRVVQREKQALSLALADGARARGSNSRVEPRREGGARISHRTSSDGRGEKRV